MWIILRFADETMTGRFGWDGLETEEYAYETGYKDFAHLIDSPARVCYNIAVRKGKIIQYVFLYKSYSRKEQRR